MGTMKNRRKHKKTLTSIVVGAIYGFGFCVLGLTVGILVFLSVSADKKLLTPEIYTSVMNVIVLGYLVIVFTLTIFFPFLAARKIKKKGQSILDVAEKIKSQDLDFDICPSGVKEIDQILNSMDQMRIALKQSLESQWRMEQNRKEQISALAHDFKTPVTILKGNLDLLQVREQDNMSKDYLKDAKGSLEQMEIYLNQLLEMTRAERGYTLHMVKEELGKLIEEAVSPLVRIAKKKEITILTEFRDQGIFVLADRILFERVIHNLITNAFDFTPPNGIIQVILNRTQENAVIVIADSGVGFSDNTLKHGTEQFYMGDTSRSRKNHYGLGLFISNSIVKQHFGSLELTNDQKTQGARIIIRIPIIKE